VGNLRSEFGHARPSGSRVSRYVRDGRTDTRTDKRTDGRTKAKLTASFPMGGGIINQNRTMYDLRWNVTNHRNVLRECRNQRDAHCSFVQHVRHADLHRALTLQKSIIYTLSIRFA